MIRKLPPLAPRTRKIPITFPTDYVEPAAPDVLEFRLQRIPELRCAKLSRTDRNFFHYVYSFDEALERARKIADGRPARLVVFDLHGDVDRVIQL